MPLHRMTAVIAVCVTIWSGLLSLHETAHGPAIRPFTATTSLGYEKAANEPWKNTGLNVVAGTVVTISASGTIMVNQFATESPAGDPSCTADASFTAPTLTCWSLVGRINNGVPFEIGSSLSFTVPVSGRLYLGVNDQISLFSDNTGAWSVAVTVPGPASLTFNVPGNQPWKGTDVRIPAGSSVAVTAGGTIMVNQFATETPAGTASCTADASFIGPGLPCWSLIGRIASLSAPFEIGAKSTFIPSTSGDLYFGVNDQINLFSDNSGSWTVHLSIQS